MRKNIEISSESEAILKKFTKSGVIYREMWDDAISKLYEIYKDGVNTRMNSCNDADYQGRGYNTRIR